MAHTANIALDKQATAHRAAEGEDIARLRALSLSERGRLIESACEAAAIIYRSRLAAGLPDIQPDPWPTSTWEFFKKHSMRVRYDARMREISDEGQ